MLRNLESLGLTKPTKNELRENSVWLRLVRTNNLRGEDRVNGQLSPANLENVRRQTWISRQVDKSNPYQCK